MSRILASFFGLYYFWVYICLLSFSPFPVSLFSFYSYFSLLKKLDSKASERTESNTTFAVESIIEYSIFLLPDTPKNARQSALENIIRWKLTLAMGIDLGKGEKEVVSHYAKSGMYIQKKPPLTSSDV